MKIVKILFYAHFSKQNSHSTLYCQISHFTLHINQIHIVSLIFQTLALSLKPKPTKINDYQSSITSLKKLRPQLYQRVSHFTTFLKWKTQYLSQKFLTTFAALDQDCPTDKDSLLQWTINPFFGHLSGYWNAITKISQVSVGKVPQIPIMNWKINWVSLMKKKN